MVLPGGTHHLRKSPTPGKRAPFELLSELSKRLPRYYKLWLLYVCLLRVTPCSLDTEHRAQRIEALSILYIFILIEVKLCEPILPLLVLQLLCSVENNYPFKKYGYTSKCVCLFSSLNFR